MAESFNLNNFLRTYQNNTYDPSNKKALAEQNMEIRSIQAAEKAINEKNLLTLTLTEKMIELGVGPRVLEQITDSAVSLVTDLINPLTDYLNKYENIFDQNVYHSEIQSYAKQMYFASQAMKEDAEKRIDGQKFLYDM